MRADAGSGVAAVFKENAAKDAIIPVDSADHWVVGSDRMDRDAADSTKNSRAFFNKTKGAFRTGSASSSQWDDANVGTQSYAEGSNTTASASRAHAEGLSTVASASEAHAEGQSTTASGQCSHAEGYTTIASGTASHAEGWQTKATYSNAHAEGYSSEATAAGGAHAGGSFALANRWGQSARAGWRFAVTGDAQASQMVSELQTTDAVAQPLTAGPDPVKFATGEVNVFTLLASRAHKVTIDAVARRTDVQGEMAGFTWEGLVGRDSTGSARIIGSPVTKVWSDAGAAAWTLTVSVNTTDATNNYLAITATGEAGKTIRWVAELRSVEVAG